MAVKSSPLRSQGALSPRSTVTPGRHLCAPTGFWCRTASMTRTKRLAETAGAMKVADGFEPGAVIGPLIDMKAVEKVEAHIADAVKKGAKVAGGGKRSVLGGTFSSRPCGSM